METRVVKRLKGNKFKGLICKINIMAKTNYLYFVVTKEMQIVLKYYVTVLKNKGFSVPCNILFMP